MIFLKTALMTGAVALTLATGALMTTAAPAAARVVCNNSGDCWHTDGNYRYGRDVGATYHNDDWYFHQRWDGGDRHYRDHHEGRGYYRSGVWIGL
jgi:hypothetical protein